MWERPTYSNKAYLPNLRHMKRSPIYEMCIALFYNERSFIFIISICFRGSIFFAGEFIGRERIRDQEKDAARIPRAVREQSCSPSHVTRTVVPPSACDPKVSLFANIPQQLSLNPPLIPNHGSSRCSELFVHWAPEPWFVFDGEG